MDVEGSGDGDGDGDDGLATFDKIADDFFLIWPELGRAAEWDASGQSGLAALLVFGSE